MKYLKKFNEGYKQTIIDDLININDNDDLIYFIDKYDFKSNFILNGEILDFKKIKIIGSGSFGLVYKYKNNIFKLTFDKNTYLMARKLIGKKFKHLVNILDVEVLHNKIKSLFLIKMEECFQLSEFLKAIFMDLNITYYIKHYIYGNFNIETIKDEINRKILYEYEDDGEIKEKVINEIHNFKLYKQIEEIKQELIESVLSKYQIDNNVDNFMLNKQGELCLIDFIYPKI